MEVHMQNIIKSSAGEIQFRWCKQTHIALADIWRADPDEAQSRHCPVSFHILGRPHTYQLPCRFHPAP